MIALMALSLMGAGRGFMSSGGGGGGGAMGSQGEAMSAGMEGLNKIISENIKRSFGTFNTMA